jgi:hypothetical protein
MYLLLQVVLAVVVEHALVVVERVACLDLLVNH